jgi:predicted RNase H-like HicB family nuclease
MIEFRNGTGKRNSMKYKVVIHQSPEGYAVSCPGLPGCWSEGKTESEAMENIRSAIKEYLAAVNESLKDADVGTSDPSKI